MADDKGKSGFGSNNAVVVALVAASAVWFARVAPLEPSRPAPIETRVEARLDDQDIEARLWQDPLEAVAKQAQKFDGGQKRECADPKKKADTEATRHCRSPLSNTWSAQAANSDRVMVLAVIVPGASYFEASETRRRLRYAVLAGLHAERFQPIDNQHIGYFRPENHQPGLPDAIPFESFRHAEKAESVLLLWLDEDIFKGASARSGGAVQRLAALSDAVCPPDKCKSAPKFSVIGPYSSDAQKNFAVPREEAFVCRKAGKAADAPLEFSFYSYSATSPAKPEHGPPACSAGERKQEIRLSTVSTVLDDRKLANVLVDELKRRGLGPTRWLPLTDPVLPHVALVSDFDTEYGREIVHAFEGALSCDRADGEARENCARIIDDNGIRELTYLRGLDGMQPAKADKTKKEKDPKDASNFSLKPQENAFGPGQFDYLRRMADRLQAEDERLWRDKKTRIKAIGVLGNDVFDKLLVLRALRPLFPEAIFFTTDFDHALAGADELEWSRNLIVASGYGSTVSEKWQLDIPPFRDGNQTSAFLATRLASKEIRGRNELSQKRISAAMEDPRLYEIDRSGEFIELPTKELEAGAAQADAVQPAPNALFRPLEEGARYGFAVVLLLCALLLGAAVRRKLTPPYLPSTVWSIVAILVIAAFCTFLWTDIAPILTEHGLGQPKSLIYNRDQIEKRFALSHWECSDRKGRSVGPEWDNYVSATSLQRVAWRVAGYTAVMGLLFFVLAFIYGFPNVPWRGSYNLIYHVTNAISAVLFVLTFFVVDATVAFIVFVNFLQSNVTQWPDKTREKFIKQLGFDDQLIDEWIDLKFIAARTDCIAWMIYAPFVIFMLFIISRSQIFANFAPNKPIFVVSMISFLIVFSCAMALCFKASKARNVAIGRISEGIVRARTAKAEGNTDGASKKATPEQLAGLLKLVEDLHEGSFVPLSEQPPVRALLLPLGGLGWTALLDYRLLPGL